MKMNLRLLLLLRRSVTWIFSLKMIFYHPIRERNKGLNPSECKKTKQNKLFAQTSLNLPFSFFLSLELSTFNESPNDNGLGHSTTDALRIFFSFAFKVRSSFFRKSSV